MGKRDVLDFGDTVIPVSLAVRFSSFVTIEPRVALMFTFNFNNSIIKRTVDNRLPPSSLEFHPSSLM